MRNPEPGCHKSSSHKRHVLLVGIDGLRWDIAKEKGVADTLRRLSEEGSWHAMTMEVPTISAPGWGSILTGSTHAEHRLIDNSCVGGRTWQYPDFLAQSFYRDQSTRTFAAAGWPVLVDPSGLAPIIHPREDQQKAGLHRVIVRDGETYGYQRIDKEIAAITLAALRNDAFDVGFTYFCDVDDTGHIYDSVGEEYKAAIRRIDGYLTDIVNVIKYRSKKYEEEWLLVVTTDHGHLDSGGHGGGRPEERNSFVVAWSSTGQNVPWSPTIEPWELADLLVEAR